MGFVNQRIDTPERQAQLDRLQLISPATRKPPTASKWTADEERGLYLVSLGGGFHEIPYLFALATPDGVIEIRGEQNVQGKIPQRNVRIEWLIREVRIPRALTPQADELLQLVREALTAHGLTFNSDPVESVVIELPAPTFV